MSKLCPYIFAHRPTSCLVAFQVGNWLGVFCLIIIDSNVSHPMIKALPDTFYSDTAAPYVGSLGKFQGNLNFPLHYVDGTRAVPAQVYTLIQL
jgi:hypothetical protein